MAALDPDHTLGRVKSFIWYACFVLFFFSFQLSFFSKINVCAPYRHKYSSSPHPLSWYWLAKGSKEQFGLTCTQCHSIILISLQRVKEMRRLSYTSHKHRDKRRKRLPTKHSSYTALNSAFETGWRECWGLTHSCKGRKCWGLLIGGLAV